MFFLKRERKEKKNSKKDGTLKPTNVVYVESYLYMKFRNFVIRKKYVKSYVNQQRVLFDMKNSKRSHFPLS